MSAILLSLCSLAGLWAQGGWDVAPCLELCQIVTRQLEPYNVLTTGRGYELVNNYPFDDSGFMTFYAKNVVINPNTAGTVRLLKQGVSHTVACAQFPEDPTSVIVSFYSPGNAQKFKAQMQEMGFKLTGEKKRGSAVWSLGGLRILEGTDQQGKFKVYFFCIQDENML